MYKIIKNIQAYSIFLACILLYCPSVLGEDMVLVPSAVNLDSELGGGALSPEEIIQKVRDAELKVAIFADKDNNRVEYGIPPLRNLIKKTEERESVNHYGAKRYIERIEAIASNYPDMVILPGTEAVPFYYWGGSISPRLILKSFYKWGGSISSGLILKNFHKNILVFGLEKAEDYENLPSVSNKKPLEFSINCFINFWPIFVIVLGLVVFSIRKSCRYHFLLTSHLSANTKIKMYIPFRYIGLGVIFTVVGFVFLVNNYPFLNPKFDQYHGDKGSSPYQELIDYVNLKGGLTFWSSPDVGTANYKMGTVTFETAPYYHELLNTKDYTGFAVFAEGMKHSGIPGGVWDQVLIEYINGERKKPVWAIGELDYEEGDWMGETQTVFLLKKLTKEDVLAALRDGRMYSVIGNVKTPKPALERFQIWDDSSQKWVEMGQTVNVKEATKMRIKLSLPAGQNQTGELKIIREGEVVKVINVTSSYEDIIDFDYRKPNGKTYYRVDYNGTLISNPIFCSF